MAAPGRPAAAARAVARTAPVRFQGSLVIRSQPRGASVFINGRRVGTTPLVLRNQPVGSRAVRVGLNGYQNWTSAVRIVANQQTVLTVTLQQASTNRQHAALAPRDGSD